MRKLFLSFTTLLLFASAACAQTSTEPSRPPQSECIAAGCSGQLCVDADKAANTVSTCEWRRAYSCYKKFSACERGADGQCGWRDTPELQGCLKE